MDFSTLPLPMMSAIDLASHTLTPLQGLTSQLINQLSQPLAQGWHWISDLSGGMSHVLQSSSQPLPHVLDGILNQWHQLTHGWGAFSHSTVESFNAMWHQMNQLLHAGLHSIGVRLEQLTGLVSATALWQVGVYWLLLALMVMGVVGSFVPVLPGVALVLLAVVLWGVLTGFSGIVLSLSVAIAALILSIAIDNLAGLIGAQKAGASRWGQIGAIIGMGLGFFVLVPALPVGGPILGIILGTVLGAFVGEFMHRRDLDLQPRAKQAIKVGLAIVVGNLVGNLLQGVLAFTALIVFVIDTWSTVY